MLEDRWLRDGLEHFVLNIDRWRAEAARLRSESEAIDEVSEELFPVSTYGPDLRL